jgi:hypothetical protein
MPSDDGGPVRARNIPAEGAKEKKPVIFDHTWPMCHAGLPGHLGEPWACAMQSTSTSGFSTSAYVCRFDPAGAV